MPQRRLRLLMLLILALGVITTPAHTTFAMVPDGFAQTDALTQLSAPVAMAFSPDETLLFIIEKDGRLRIADVSPAATLTLRSTAALDLTAVTCNNSERGLLGVAVDPRFTTNRYIYLYYTFNRAQSCETIANNQAVGPNSPVNRVSRFTIGLDGIIDPASEGVLIDNIYSSAGNHNGGDLQFGPDQNLYVSVGDSGCDYAGGGCAGGNNAARDPFVLNGKILRIIPDPSLSPEQRIPSDNPYQASGTSCALAGHTGSGECQETFASGLRNPFRISFDPNISTPTFFINDVGQNAWEEINAGTAGADYRWNNCEGSYVVETTTKCAAPTANQRNPIYEYDRGVGASITGGAVIPNGVWPAGYDGRYLFADYVAGKIFLINPASPTGHLTFASNLSSLTHLRFGPGPDGLRSLYYVNFDAGVIGRITPTVGGAVPPTSVLMANPQFGSKIVTFDGSASSDAQETPLTFLWDFGNGAPLRETLTATTEYTYLQDGTFTASLQVRNANGALSNISTLQIQTDNFPPVPTIILPAANTTFGVGDSLALQAAATDSEDGALPASALSWQVILHHRAGTPSAHTHPFFGPQTGNEGVFTAPAPEDLDAASNSYLEVRLTATDSDGATAVVSRDLLPVKVALLLQSVPAGMQISVNGAPYSDGTTIISWRGYQLSLAGLPQRAPDGSWLALSKWEDRSTSTTRIITTPATSQNYTATFGRNAALSFLPLLQQP